MPGPQGVLTIRAYFQSSTECHQEVVPDGSFTKQPRRTEDAHERCHHGPERQPLDPRLGSDDVYHDMSD
jgi:hypothetical protein